MVTAAPSRFNFTFQSIVERGKRKGIMGFYLDCELGRMPVRLADCFMFWVVLVLQRAFILDNTGAMAR